MTSLRISPLTGAPPLHRRQRPHPLQRLSPTLAAAALALAYVLVKPMSLDLAAHLLRAKLFSAEGFGLWNNWWYAGHDVPGYSVLFPPLAALLTPQVVGAISAVATAALFEVLALAHFGRRAWLGALWFGAATAVDLYTGRLTFAFGLLPAVATAVALQRGRPAAAATLGFITALASPVAALFAALAGIASGVGGWLSHRDRAAVACGLGVVIASLAPVLVLSVAFPEGGVEPFALATLWPLLVICGALVILLPAEEATLRIGAALYGAGCLAAYWVPSPIGSNAARLGPLLAGPIAALVWWRRRNVWLALVALPLLYIQWQAPVRDVRTASGDPSGRAAYWQPLLRFLAAQPGSPFRVEIPFTQFHMEAYRVAPEFPIPRGWERQLDIKDNALFYNGSLNAATYEAWLHRMAVRFVAVSDVHLDYAGKQEQVLVDGGLPYLHLVLRTRHWRVYAVSHPTPIVTGAATLTAMGPNSLTLRVRRAGLALARVHFTPYWKLSGGRGCVLEQGDFTGIRLRSPGTVKLVISFSPLRVGARSPRCSVTRS